MEIFGASKYLSDLTNRKITKNRLEKLENASLEYFTKKGTIIIKIGLVISSEEIPATIAVQDMHYRSPVLAFA